MVDKDLERNIRHRGSLCRSVGEHSADSQLAIDVKTSASWQRRLKSVVEPPFLVVALVAQNCLISPDKSAMKVLSLAWQGLTAHSGRSLNVGLDPGTLPVGNTNGTVAAASGPAALPPEVPVGIGVDSRTNASPIAEHCGLVMLSISIDLC